MNEERNAEVPRARDDKGGMLMTGAILIFIGTLFLLDRIEIADFGDVMRRYWPLILVFIGLPKLFRRETVWSGLWLITIGVWLQMARLHLFDLTYRNSWPILLIALGAGLIARAFFDLMVPAEKRRES
jgi:hypothetical protein